MKQQDRIKIRVENTEYYVVGGTFQELLKAVKALPKRRYVAEQKLWLIANSLDLVQGQLENGGLRLEGGTPVSDNDNLPRSTDKVKVRVAGFTTQVSGGSFEEILTAIKSIPQRRFDSESKTWEIPGTFSEIQAYFANRTLIIEPPTDISEAAPPSVPEMPDLMPPPAPPDDLFPPIEAGFGGEYEENEVDLPAYFDEPPPPPEFSEPPKASSTPPKPPPSTSGSSDRQDKIRVRVGQMSLVIIGGRFREMLEAVKAIPGRRFDSEDKVWILPDDINSVQQHIRAKGFFISES